MNFYKDSLKIIIERAEEKDNEGRTPLPSTTRYARVCFAIPQGGEAQTALTGNTTIGGYGLSFIIFQNTVFVIFITPVIKSSTCSVVGSDFLSWSHKFLISARCCIKRHCGISITLASLIELFKSAIPGA